jgi:hypothetical protein
MTIFLLTSLFFVTTIPAVLTREEQVSQQREEAGMRVLNTKKANKKFSKSLDKRIHFQT